MRNEFDVKNSETPANDSDPLLQVRNLTTYFDTSHSLLNRLLGETTDPVRAVDGISFDIHRGETLGLVGESGCGKSTTGESILQLLEPTSGTVEYDGTDLVGSDDLFSFRQQAGIVFQDPFSSLDPRMTAGASIRQPLDIHEWPWPDDGVETTAAVSSDGIAPTVSVADDIHRVGGIEPIDGVATVHLTLTRKRPQTTSADLPTETTIAHDENAAIVAFDGDAVEVQIDEPLTVRVSGGETLTIDVRVGRSDAALRRERVEWLLERVGLSADQKDRYPNEFSGGQRQRIGIARALALDPAFLVLDEPTSALDVSVQAQILNLLSDLQSEFDLTYLFISHDLSVIRHICDRVAVMYLGKIAEVAPTEELFSDPKHPYTEALLESVPRASIEEKHRDIDPLAGDVPSPRNPPSGCRFRTRCPQIIPPASIETSQPAYRAIMDVRRRIEHRDINLEEIREATATSTAAVEMLFDRLLEDDIELAGPDHDRLTTAFERLIDDDWEQAADLLRDHYESICETHEPSPGRVACHLSDLPDDVSPSDVNRVETRD